LNVKLKLTKGGKKEMGFLKKNWLKILVAVIALTGAVLMLVPTFIADTITFVGASQTIGIIIFFVGLVAFLCLKLSDKTKTYAKYALLATSILVLSFMAIGVSGFNKDSDKADGAFGKAYAYFASVESTVEEGEIAVEAAKTKLASVNVLLAGGLVEVAPGASVTVAGLQGLVIASPTATLASLGPEIGADATKTLAAVLIGNEDLEDITATTTVLAAYTILAGNKGALTIGIADAEASLALGKAQINDANAAAFTLLFGYVVMMLAFGLIPALFTVKKITCREQK